MLDVVSAEPSDVPTLPGEPVSRRPSWLSAKRPASGEGIGALDVDDVVDESWLDGGSPRRSRSSVSDPPRSTASTSERFADPVSGTRASDAPPIAAQFDVAALKAQGFGTIVGEPADNGSSRSSLRERLGVRARGPRPVEVPESPPKPPVTVRKGPGASPASGAGAAAATLGKPAGTKGSPSTASQPSQSRRRSRPRVRRVTRVLRRVDAWSVFKVSLIFWITMYLVVMMAGVLLWSVMASTGTLDNLESFITKTFALDSFAFNGGKIFQASAMLGLVLVVAATAATVTMAVFFNLISDLTGGVRLTVLEEEIQRVEPQAWSETAAPKRP
jgi:low affinity Fe/Cu permease